MSALPPKADIGTLDFFLDEPISQLSGLIAVARLTQGISPKHCKSARLPGKGLLAKCLISTSLSSGGGTGFRAFDNRPVSCRVQPSVVSTPKEMRYVLR